ncbi:MAG: ATP-binding protein [Ignavibacteriales bacterium]|nr:ATP-binding protein [Ignavibacteriales bacterium]
MNNLMSNAIKYTDAHGRIRVEAGPSDTGVRIAVSDTGMGISAEDIPHIFTKFYKARNASKSGSHGTGVGLALVKAFSEGHDAKISVTSTIGVGSTFTIEVPVAPENGQPTSSGYNEGTE